MPEKKKYEYEIVTFTFNGKQYKCTGKSLNEAHAKAAKKKLDLEMALGTSGGNMLVQDWAEEWFETYKSYSIAEGTYQNYKLYIKTICKHIGNMKIKDVEGVHLQKILNSLSGKSKSYILKVKATICSMFKQARILRKIAYDPSESLVMPKAKNGTRRSLTNAERSNVLKHAEVHHAGLYVKLMLYCGLRPSEVCALEWKHIDFDNKMLHVKQALKAGTSRIDAPKTESGIRSVPIPDKLLDTLLAVRGDYNEPVLKQTTTNKRHTKESLNGLWNNFKRELDIFLGAKLYRNKIIESKIAPDLVPYCLRHTYCTDLQDAGVPINVAKYLMGHNDISTTANIYTHITNETLKEAAEKINNHA